MNSTLPSIGTVNKILPFQTAAKTPRLDNTGPEWSVPSAADLSVCEREIVRDLSSRGRPAKAVKADDVTKRVARVEAACKKMRKQVVEEWTYLRWV